MSEQRQYDESDQPDEPKEPKEPQKTPVWLYVILLAIVFVFATLDFHQSIFHSFNCITSRLAATNKASNGLYMDNQVILRGLGDDVTKFAGDHGLILLEGCDLSYLNTRVNPNPNLKKQQQSPLIMRLYELPPDEIPPGSDFETEIGKIEIDSKTSNINADLNYLTRLAVLTGDPCARPADSGGAGGGPFGDPYIPDPETNEDEQASGAFLDQWAFGPDGINLPDPPSFKGSRVRVAVFDTSPYRNRLPFLRIIGIAQPSFMWLIGWDATGPTTVSDHGLFVAGLIHRIAPSSNIHLVQVLNYNGCGQLWVLNKALEDYTSRISRWSGTLNRTVINMSLGIKKANLQNQDDLDTLHAAIDDAHGRGAVIVAAAGNDSPGKDEDGNTVDPIAMQYPAKYSNVIGVAATNKDRVRSCFSNNGDVAAPGGDGRFTVTNDDGTTEEKCEPRADTWDQLPGPNGGPVCDSNAPGNCTYIMISLAQTRNGQQYIYWSGTSFATPLVSGLAALVYEQTSAGPDEVRNRIMDGAQDSGPDLGAGIIDLCETPGLRSSACP